MPHPLAMAEESELAPARVDKAMAGVIAASEAEPPELPAQPAQAPSPPSRPAWHPDPTQAPTTTRQWAEVTRLQASTLRNEGRQTREEAALVRRAPQTERASRRQLADNPHPDHFTPISPTILMPSRHAPRNAGGQRGSSG